MGKQGPCYHCGVTSTPLWRNGPPEKPVLCNACGSRWRTKGTLTNYTPLHARAEADDFEDHKISRMRGISINKNKEIKSMKRKHYYDNVASGGFDYDNNHGYLKVIDEDTSNRSSAGSAISNTESCAQFGSADAGTGQSIVWDSNVPSWKMSCVGRPKVSSVEKLTKDLYTILHEQQSSYLSGSSHEDLIFESETPMVSVEIGHGSVLIRHPSSIGRDDESEASSLSFDNKPYPINEAYSHYLALSVHNDRKGVNISSLAGDKFKNPDAKGMQQEQSKRYKLQHEKVQLLGLHNSPLCYIDLNDIVNFDEYLRQLTKEEQQQLQKYLPFIDASKFPDSMRSMFDSFQFKENLSSFQQLLTEGVFDLSCPGLKHEDCKTVKRFALSNLTKSKWIEHYHLLKEHKTNTRGLCAEGGSNAFTSNNSVNGNHSLNCSEGKTMMKSPKRVIMKATNEHKELRDSEGSCFSPRSLFTLPPDGRTLMLDSFHFVSESSDQDLLLEVPSNSSFPEAELLHPNPYTGSEQASTSSSTVYPHLGFA